MPRLWFPAVLCCLFVTQFAEAQQSKDSRWAATTLADVDEDFGFQGEYSGRAAVVTGDAVRRQKIGLQVVALGNGEFAGAVYEGGLPGSGWDRKQREVIAGKRTGEGLELVGKDVRIVVKDGTAKLAAVERQLVGGLVKVERKSPTLGQSPPPGAVVIFDGRSSEHLKTPKITPEGLLQEGTEITKLANDFTLHLEFLLPYMPYARGQGRSNSGIYLHSRYEVQVLDSFGLAGEFNECAALYRYQKPTVNMCLPPLQWQTYDILFTAPKFDSDGNKSTNGRLTVHHNGVPVHRDFEFERCTGGGQRVGEGPNPLPIKIQNHSNPVRFRNIWMVSHDKPRGDESIAGR